MNIRKSRVSIVERQDPAMSICKSRVSIVER
jgi:hypothetical protein